jgi:hypothetical protein
MADTVEEPQLQNGAAPAESETEQNPIPEPQLQTEPKLTGEIPEIEADLTPEEVQSEVTDAKPEEVQSEVKPEEVKTVVTDAKPEEAQSEVKPEEVQSVVTDTKPDLTDVDLSPGGSEEIPIRSTEVEQESTTSVLKKDDDGNKTFTMRELLSELKSEEGDGTPHSSASPFRFLLSFSLVSADLS